MKPDRVQEGRLMIVKKSDPNSIMLMVSVCLDIRNRDLQNVVKNEP